MLHNFPTPRMIPISTPTGGETAFALYEYDRPEPSNVLNTPPILMLHGWPETAHSWLHPMRALHEAGYRVLAIDLKGFGHSSAPTEIAPYAITTLAAEYIALLDALDMEKVILCGHDWGGACAWGTTVLHPDRIAGVISLCTPHLPAPPAPPTEIMKKRLGEHYYIVQFQQPDRPEAAFTGHEDDFFTMVFQQPLPRKFWPKLIPEIYDMPGQLHNPDRRVGETVVSQSVITHYAEIYRATGFTGGINYYRNIDRNWETYSQRDVTIKQPCLWVGADLDLFLPPEASTPMDGLIENLERHIIPECGHWLTWEAPDRVSQLIEDWLGRNFPVS